MFHRPSFTLVSVLASYVRQSQGGNSVGFPPLRARSLNYAFLRVHCRSTVSNIAALQLVL